MSASAGTPPRGEPSTNSPPLASGRFSPISLRYLGAWPGSPWGVCKIRGCDRNHALERHHTPPFEESRRTTYQGLGNLCPKHHDQVTHRGYDTTDNHDGTWDLHAPAHAPPGEAAA